MASDNPPAFEDLTKQEKLWLQNKKTVKLIDEAKAEVDQGYVGLNLTFGTALTKDEKELIKKAPKKEQANLTSALLKQKTDGNTNNFTTEEFEAYGNAFSRETVLVPAEDKKKVAPFTILKGFDPKVAERMRKGKKFEEAEKARKAKEKEAQEVAALRDLKTEQVEDLSSELAKGVRAAKETKFKTSFQSRAKKLKKKDPNKGLAWEVMEEGFRPEQIVLTGVGFPSKGEVTERKDVVVDEADQAIATKKLLRKAEDLTIENQQTIEKRYKETIKKLEKDFKIDKQPDAKDIEAYQEEVDKAKATRIAELAEQEKIYRKSIEKIKAREGVKKLRNIKEVKPRDPSELGVSFDIVPLVDPSTNKDIDIIETLINKPAGKDEETKAAKLYFERVGSPIQGLMNIAYDIVYAKEKFRQEGKQKNPEDIAEDVNSGLLLNLAKNSESLQQQVEENKTVRQEYAAQRKALRIKLGLPPRKTIPEDNKENIKIRKAEEKALREISNKYRNDINLLSSSQRAFIEDTIEEVKDLSSTEKKDKIAELLADRALMGIWQKGTGKIKAELAQSWINKNLSTETKRWLKAHIESDRNSINRLQQTHWGYNPFNYLPTSYVNSLAYPLSPDVQSALRAGDLKTALQMLSSDILPTEIVRLGNRLADKIGNTKIKINPNIRKGPMGASAGLFNPKTNTIEINPQEGMNAHVLLHEVTHAVTSATLANKSHPVTKQLNTLFNDVKDKLGTAYGAQNLDEFVSETFSNPEFQKILARINVKGQPVTALQRFINTVVNLLRQVIGKPTTPLTALESADSLIEQIISPSPKFRDAPTLFMNSDAEGVRKVAQELGKTMKETTSMSAAEKSTYLDHASEFITNNSILDAAKNFFLGLTDSLIIGDIADNIGIVGGEGTRKLGTELNDTILRQRGGMDTAGRLFDDAIKLVTGILNKSSNKGMETLINDLIYNDNYGATIWQVDPFGSKPQVKDKKTGKLRDQWTTITVNGTKESVNLTEKWELQQGVIRQIKALNENALEDAKTAYTTMRDFYQDRFKELKQTLFKQIDDSVGEGSKGANKIKAVFEKIFDDKTLKVYFPLTREGNYKVVYELKEKIEGRDPLVVEMFTTREAAKRRVKEITEQGVSVGEPKLTNDADSLKRYFDKAPPTSFVGQVLDIVKESDADAEQKKAIKEDIVQLFINHLPETSYARSLQGRQTVYGHDKDAVNAFREKGYSIGRETVRLKFGQEIRNIEKEIIEVARIAEETPENFPNQWYLPAINRVAKELLKRAKFAREGAAHKDWEKVVKTANQGAFIYTIGFNVSSAIVNLSQIPLFVYPYFTAEYGLVPAFKAIKKAYARVANSGNKIDEYFDIVETKDEEGNILSRDYVLKENLTSVTGRELSEEERADIKRFATLVDVAQERGQLTKSFIVDALGLEESGKRKKGDWRDFLKLDNIAAISAIPFNQAERLNRQVTLMAAYDLALSEGMSEKEAAFKALRQAQETNGGAVLETAPRWAQQGIGRVALMYKSYGLRMYSTMMKSTMNYLDNMFAPAEGETETERDARIAAKKLAKNQIIGVHISALFFAGIQGLPLYGAIELMYNLFGDDEEKDFDTVVRQYVGEGYYKGAINALTGVDVATRIRLTGLLIQENRFNRDASKEEQIAHYLGGPALSTVNRLTRAGIDFYEGELERGIENMLPAAVANFLKGTFGRVAREGYKTRRGDVILDDLTGGDVAGIAFGFPPQEYTKTQEVNNIKKGIDTAINKKRSKLLKKYYIALRHNDTREMSKIIKDIQAFNKRHTLAPISMDSIERSIKRHIQSSKDISQHNGVPISSTNRMLLQKEFSMW